MRLFFLLVLAFIAALAVLDGKGRIFQLFDFLPDRGALVRQDIRVKDVETGNYCATLRGGYRICQWYMVILTETGPTLRLFLDPLLEKGDGRYALLQPGDQLRVGLHGDIAYTLVRTSTEQPLPGLEARVSLQDEAQLRGWRRGVVRQAGGGLLADVVVLCVAYGFVRRMRFPLRAYLAYLLCTVLVMAISIWVERPRSLPASHQLFDQPVTVGAIGERLACRPGWLKLSRRCEPQNFLTDMQGNIWPIAYPGALMLPLKRGEYVILGVSNNMVYRIKNGVPPASKQGCRFRDHPTSRERKVVWMCDDEAARIERGRDPIRTMISRIGEMPSRIDPLRFEWTQEAHTDAQKRHKRRLFMGLYMPLLAWLFIALTYLHGGRDNDPERSRP